MKRLLVRRPAGALPVLVLLFALALPASLRAQRPVDLGVYGGRAGVALDGADLLGAALGWQPGPMGLRVSGAVGWRNGALDPWSGTVHHGGEPDAWAVDADLVVSPFRAGPLRPFARVVEPYVFAGAGPAGLELAPGVWDNFWTAGWGVGVAIPLGSRVALSVEGRKRHLVDTGGRADPFLPGGGWEGRAGFSVRLGGDRARPRPARRPRPRPRRDVANRGRFPEPADTLHLEDGRLVPRIPAGAAAGDLGDAAPADEAGPVRYARPATASATAAGILDSGDALLGVGYRYGGTDPRTGLDCSAFVQRVFREHGVRLPRTSRQQARTGRALPTDLDALLPGDLLFFASRGSRIDHVAIYAGDGTILHSSGSGRGVRYDDLGGRRGRWFLENWVAARRVL